MSVAAAVPRGPLTHPRLPLLLWLGAGVAAVGLFFAAGWVGLPSGAAFTVCAFRRLTGIPCPGCGLTRAMGALARGELLLALHFHPFAPLVLAEAGALWAGIGASVLGRPLALPPRFLERVVIWQTAAFVALWLGRLATGTLPW
ncbi:MAG TPA: DUF2752 domain-containing protein [Thermoanaerobaculia bacterium]|nr:DUF2752 domain-containing protein [Thermoanaerobaculia bacterium]HXT51050.1 DUF2752 domain-containing protein [Thermoanaerobaculia bacterium]